MRLDHLLSREKRQAKSKPNPRSSFWGNRDVETEVKKSGSEPQQNRRKAGYDLTELLIETLYRFEGSEEMKNLQVFLENCTGKMKRKDENVKIQSRLRSASDCAKMQPRYTQWLPSSIRLSKINMS